MTSATKSARGARLSASLRQMAGRLEAALHGDLDAAHWHFQPTPQTASIHWLMGHLTSTFGATFPSALGAGSSLPEDFRKTFGMGSKPVSAGPGVPTPEQIMEQFHQAVSFYQRALEEVADETLDQALPDGHPLQTLFPSVAAFMEGGIGFHTAYHMGQIALLRRIQGLPAGFGL